EGNILYPKLVGSSININPAWQMLALFAFAFLFGFVGPLLAVPLAAITATLPRYAIKRYKDSALYRCERNHRVTPQAQALAATTAEVVPEPPAPAPEPEVPSPRRRKRLTPSR